MIVFHFAIAIVIIIGIILVGILAKTLKSPLKVISIAIATMAVILFCSYGLKGYFGFKGIIGNNLDRLERLQK